MTNATHDRMHELLCAYVLDEATADERAEVERALQGSPELAREKERIEATIGLVQGAMGKSEALSDAKREEVLRAAVPPALRPVRPWWKETWVRAAAGILFVSFALGGWSVYEQSRRAMVPCEIASVDRDDDLAYKQGRPAGDPNGVWKSAERSNEKDRDRASAGHAGDDASSVPKREETLLADLEHKDKDSSTGEVARRLEGDRKETGGLGDAGEGRAQRADRDRLDDQSSVDAEELVAANEPRPGGDPSAPKDARLSLAEGAPAGGGPASKPAGSGGGGGGSASTQSTFPVKEPTNFGLPVNAIAGQAAGGDGNNVYHLSTQQPGTGAPIGGALTKTDQAVVDSLYGRFDGGGGASAPAPGTAVLPGEKRLAEQQFVDLKQIPVDASRGFYTWRDTTSPTAGGVAPAPETKKADAFTRSGGKSGELREQLKNVDGGVVKLPADTEAELVTLEEDVLTVSGGLDLRALDVPPDPSASIITERIRLIDSLTDDNDGRALGDEDRFILQKLGLQPGQAIPPITIELRLKHRDEYVDHWCQRIRRHCERRPDERPRDMFFRFWGDNPFELTALDPLSTFSADVDTASYALARRYIREGKLPEKAQIRTEEFVNAFKADVPPPTQGTFGITTTLAPSRFGAAAPGEPATSARDLLRVVIRGKDVPKAERKPLALTFVVDVSGSMKEQNRIEMVKHAMRLLVSQLDARDSIAIVKFSTDAAMVLPMTSAKHKDVIESAIHPLAAEGSTNSEAGLRMGYAEAVTKLNPEATNRVVFLSDGVANVGVTDPNVISDGVKQLREKGIYLNTIGVGMNNHNDVLLEQLANKGDGVCNYVDTPDEAKKVFVDQFMGTVETIARDVKLQVEFDPTQVFRYRLLGYENRAVADADFRNDKVDAGEVGAGHQVTALYEIEYAHPQPTSEKPLATVRVRYKAPRNPNAPTANEEASEIAQNVTIAQRTSWEGAGPGYRKSTLVAQFAEFLRRSIHARNDSFDQMIADAKKLESEARDAEFTELVTLLDQSKALILTGWPHKDELALAIDQIRENHVLRAQLEHLASERDKQLLADLEKSNREMESRLRELLRRRLEQPR